MVDPTTDPADDMRSRIRDLRKERADNVPGQHVVSKTILKEFTDAHGMLHEISVRYPRARTNVKGPGGAGKFRNFVPAASASAEKLWQEVENELPHVFELCANDRLHDDPDAVDMVRAAIALHFIRGRHTPVVHNQGYRAIRGEVKRLAMAQPEFEREFRRRHSGLYPAGPEASELLFAEMVNEWDEDFDAGLMLRESVERLFKRAKAWLANHEIEVIHPAAGMFLIGDTPALTVDRNGRLGSASGVALGDAEQIVLPLGPKTLVAVGPRAAVGTVPEAVVQGLNRYQIRAATDYVYAHPKSNLEDFIRSERFGSV